MSTLKVNEIQDTSGNVQYTAKAWVNFNGTGTVAIRESGNVSSITDNGTGLYTVNFTNAMTDANYSISGFCNYINTFYAGGVTSNSNYSPSTSSVTVATIQTNVGTLIDVSYVNVSVFR